VLDVDSPRTTRSRRGTPAAPRRSSRTPAGMVRIGGKALNADEASTVGMLLALKTQPSPLKHAAAVVPVGVELGDEDAEGEDDPDAAGSPDV
jgi:hypothetical protein